MKLLICSDLHLRPDLPRCRTDEDWIETQRKQLEFIAITSNEEKCPIAICGDIFHKSQVPDKLKNMFIETFIENTEQNVYIMSGQHDQPYHDWNNIENSSFGVLWNLVRQDTQFKSMGEIGFFAHYGIDAEDYRKEQKLYFFHTLVFPDKKSMPPNVNAETAQGRLDKYPAKWIFCGDNHHGFHYKKGDRHVLVPGCMNRQASDFKDYQPKIWLVDTEKGTADPILIPDDVKMVDDSYIVEDSERKSRISAFVESIHKSEKISLDFVENVNKAILKNKKLSKGVIKTINELMEA